MRRKERRRKPRLTIGRREGRLVRKMSVVILKKMMKSRTSTMSKELSVRRKRKRRWISNFWIMRRIALLMRSWFRG